MAFDLEKQLGYNLNRTAILFRRELGRALRAHSGMTPEQWQTLATLWSAEGPLTPTEISRVTLQDLPSISRMVKRMTDNGWVRRVPDPDDGRSFRVELTRGGRALGAKVPEELLGWFERYTGALNRNEQNQLMKLLRKLRDALGDD